MEGDGKTISETNEFGSWMTLEEVNAMTPEDRFEWCVDQIRLSPGQIEILHMMLTGKVMANV